jgi:hypothetical protein
MSINGAKVSEDLLAPGWSKYDRTCLYDTYDVTSLLREGDNAIGLVLGNGMYNVRGGRYIKFKGSFVAQAICHVRLEYADGTTEIICTDSSGGRIPDRSRFRAFMAGRTTMLAWNLVIGTALVLMTQGGQSRRKWTGLVGRSRGCRVPHRRSGIRRA